MESLLRRCSLILFILLMLLFPAMGFAQGQVTTIDSLFVDLWPDYDKTSVLVLLTGTLAPDTQLPGSVTLPLPKDAQLNAVARIDAKDGKMKDDVVSSRDPSGAISFITPDLRFRVEYYLPYKSEAKKRSFDYTWNASVAVKALNLKVQQPSSAALLFTEPAAANTVKGNDGFLYHTFSPRTIPAGQPFSVHVKYEMSSDQLSVQNLPAPEKSSPTTEAARSSEPVSPRNWSLLIMILGGLIIIAVAIWYMASRRTAEGASANDDATVRDRSPETFCGNCGTEAREGDKYCSDCGKPL